METLKGPDKACDFLLKTAQQELSLGEYKTPNGSQATAAHPSPRYWVKWGDQISENHTGDN